MKELGVEWAEPDAGDAPGPQLGLPDDEITTWVDTSSYGTQKFDALAAHASQTENIFFLRMGRDRFVELMGGRPSSGSATPPGRRCPRTTCSPDCADGASGCCRGVPSVTGMAHPRHNSSVITSPGWATRYE